MFSTMMMAVMSHPTPCAGGPREQAKGPASWPTTASTFASGKPPSIQLLPKVLKAWKNVGVLLGGTTVKMPQCRMCECADVQVKESFKTL